MAVEPALLTQETRDRLCEAVRNAYSSAARQPEGTHPFPVGREFAASLGYPPGLLDSSPSVAVEAFAGVSNVAVFADIPEGANVLDLGCGAGLDALIAAGRVGARGRVIGVDFSEAMLARVRRAAVGGRRAQSPRVPRRSGAASRQRGIDRRGTRQRYLQPESGAGSDLSRACTNPPARWRGVRRRVDPLRAAAVEDPVERGRLVRLNRGCRGRRGLPRGVPGSRVPRRSHPPHPPECANKEFERPGSRGACSSLGYSRGLMVQASQPGPILIDRGRTYRLRSAS